MDFKRTTVAQFEEIVRLIKLGRSDRNISKTLRCRRTLVAGIRKNTLTRESLEKLQASERAAPLWTSQVDWEVVRKDMLDGHQIKRIWEESAGTVTSQSKFFKYVRTRFAPLMLATVTLRDFKPGEYCGSRLRRHID